MKVQLSLVRDDLTVRKRIVKDTGWKSEELPPRFSPYPTTKPMAARWEWRCFTLTCDDGRNFRLLLEVSPQLGKWKAMLIKLSETGDPTAIMRLEDQPGQHGGGLHVHANCDQRQHLTGADSVDMVYTLPEHRRHRRRRGGWTKPLFCMTVSAFFHTHPLAEQEELSL